MGPSTSRPRHAGLRLVLLALLALATEGRWTEVRLAYRPKFRYAHGAAVTQWTPASAAGNSSDPFSLLVSHGYNNRGAPDWRSDAWVFDSHPRGWREVATGSLANDAVPFARYGHSLALVRPGVVVLFGGDDGGHKDTGRRQGYVFGSFRNDLWTLDVAKGEWVRRDDPRLGPRHNPAPRSLHAWAPVYVDGRASKAQPPPAGPRATPGPSGASSATPELGFALLLFGMVRGHPDPITGQGADVLSDAEDSWLLLPPGSTLDVVRWRNQRGVLAPLFAGGRAHATAAGAANSTWRWVPLELPGTSGPPHGPGTRHGHASSLVVHGRDGAWTEGEFFLFGGSQFRCADLVDDHHDPSAAAPSAASPTAGSKDPWSETGSQAAPHRPSPTPIVPPLTGLRGAAVEAASRLHTARRWVYASPSRQAYSCVRADLWSLSMRWKAVPSPTGTGRQFTIELGPWRQFSLPPSLEPTLASEQGRPSALKDLEAPERLWPRPRTNAALAWTGSSLLLFGGGTCRPGCDCLSDTWLWDLHAGTWTRLDEDPTIADSGVHPPRRYRHSLSSPEAFLQLAVLPTPVSAAASGPGTSESAGGGNSGTGGGVGPGGPVGADLLRTARIPVVLFGGESYGPSTYFDDVWIWTADESSLAAVDRSNERVFRGAQGLGNRAAYGPITMPMSDASELNGKRPASGGAASSGVTSSGGSGNGTSDAEFSLLRWLGGEADGPTHSSPSTTRSIAWILFFLISCPVGALSLYLFCVRRRRAAPLLARPVRPIRRTRGLRDED